MAILPGTPRPPTEPIVSTVSGRPTTAWVSHLQDVADRTAQIGVGTIKADNAPAGYIGEFQSATVASGSAVSMTSGGTINITSLSLTAGDWDVSGVVAILAASTTQFRAIEGGIGTTSAAIPDLATGASAIIAYSSQTPGINFGFPVGPTRISLAATTTVYLCASAVFSAPGCLGYGFLRARRMR